MSSLAIIFKTLPACGQSLPWGRPLWSSRRWPCRCPCRWPAGGNPEKRWWLGVGKLPLWEGSEGSDDNRGGPWARTRGGLAKAGAGAVKTAWWITDGS